MKLRLAAGLSLMLLGAIAVAPAARAFTIQPLDSGSDGAANFQDPANKTPFQSQPTNHPGTAPGNSVSIGDSNFSFSVSGGQPGYGGLNFQRGFMDLPPPADLRIIDGR
jgi:hypothetical protein